MTRFIVKSFFLCISAFFIIIAILTLGDDGLKKERLGSVAKGIETDVLILGTSRAYRHFDTEILERVTGKDFFNLGLDASGFKTQKELLSYYLKYNGYPSEVIWEYNFGFLNEEEAIYDYSLLLPIADEKNIFALLNEYGHISKWIYPINIFRYIGHSDLVLRGIKNQLRPKVYLDFKIQDLKWNRRDFKYMYLNGDYKYQKKISASSLNSYLDIVNDLKENNVNLIMVFTPMYSGVFLKNDEKEELLKFYDSLFANNSVKNLNFLHSPISNDTINFYNVLHMNRSGVDKFLKEFLNAF